MSKILVSFKILHSCKYLWKVKLQGNYTYTYTQDENQAVFETLEYLNGSENSLADYLVKKNTLADKFPVL